MATMAHYGHLIPNLRRIQSEYGRAAMIAKGQGHELPSVNVELRAHKGKQLRGKSKHFLFITNPTVCTNGGSVKWRLQKKYTEQKEKGDIQSRESATQSQRWACLLPSGSLGGLSRPLTWRLGLGYRESARRRSNRNLSASAAPL